MGVASTVTAWLTQTVGFESSGVLSDTLTGSLSTFRVSDSVALGSAAAFVACSLTGSCPEPLTYSRVSTAPVQLAGCGHSCQLESFGAVNEGSAIGSPAPAWTLKLQ